MKTKLNWKKKWLEDKSGFWYSAKVPILNWEYIIDGLDRCEVNNKNQESYNYYEFAAGVFLSSTADDVIKISKKEFKTKEAATNACEKHLQTTAEKFNKWIKS